jgi:hypothetical protein
LNQAVESAKAPEVRSGAGQRKCFIDFVQITAGQFELSGARVFGYVIRVGGLGYHKYKPLPQQKPQSHLARRGMVRIRDLPKNPAAGRPMIRELAVT